MAINGKIPEKLSRLPEIANNLWWSWDYETRQLFRRLDYTLWRRTQHNPVAMLQDISAEKLEKAAADSAFVRYYNKICLRFDEQLEKKKTWFEETYAPHTEKTIAYFSFEFGLHNSIPIYSGGLGILSGDHVKEASDLGLPLTAVGFFYPQGYFRQRIPAHGWQEAIYIELDTSRAPVALVLNGDGQPVKISVNIDGTDVYAQIWKVNVGRVNLYLLDSNVHENDPWNRELTARLYSGDSEMRIRQEIMLGIGGVRALRALDVTPDLWHLNEGHSAFLVLECVREIVEKEGISFHDAAMRVRKQTLFTTHTPVPAGHDAFAFHMMEKYFREYWPQLNLDREGFLNLGKHEEPWGVAFNMTVLALKMSDQANGVSELHGAISREMWKSVWPKISNVDDIPISGVTNGVHVPTWIAPEMNQLFAKYIGTDWIDRHDDPTMWEKVDDIPAEELWATHTLLRNKLLRYMRERARRRWIDGRLDASQVLTGGSFLSPTALTIGFARRFATYKRATLIFRDAERLRRMVRKSGQPLQIIFAGKAHPADDPGKHMIQEIYNISKAHDWGGRIAFLPDYDMHSARYMKQGVDVWLNNPRRPREASGTSGMKASLNGVPNLSVLDGWWEEGYNGANGWAIGKNQPYDDPELQDREDVESLYQLLEDEIIPLYYDRDRDGIPRGWVQVMRDAIKSNAWEFSMRRMVKDYTNKLYVPALDKVDVKV